jgi:zincin-like metallopeptidase
VHESNAQGPHRAGRAASALRRADWRVRALQSWHAEALIAATRADLRISGERAFYVAAADVIQVPPQPAFFEQINYYRTCFHELGHWTGHVSRLARDLSGGFGSKTCAREELVAEMASAFVCAALGITPTVRHTDYLAISVLGSKCCARTTKRSSAPRAQHPRRRISCSPSGLRLPPRSARQHERDRSPRGLSAPLRSSKMDDLDQFFGGLGRVDRRPKAVGSCHRFRYPPGVYVFH